MHSVRHAAPPHPEQKLRAIFHVQNWNGYSACDAVCKVNKWFADDVLRSVKSEFLPKSDLSCWIDNICWMEWYPSISKTFFSTPAFSAQGHSAMLVSPGKGSCRHHRFGRALARCHCKQWVPDRLIGLGVRSFRLKVLQQNPIFVMNCEK